MDNENRKLKLLFILGLIAFLIISGLVSIADLGLFFVNPDQIGVRLSVVAFSGFLVIVAWIIARKTELQKGVWLGLGLAWLPLIALIFMVITNPYDLQSTSQWLGSATIDYGVSPLIYQLTQLSVFCTVTFLALFHQSNDRLKLIAGLLPGLLALLILIGLLALPAPHFQG